LTPAPKKDRFAFLQWPLPQRLDWLSVLRGICSLWIVYYHLFAPYLWEPLPTTNGRFIKMLYRRYAREGVTGFWAHAQFVHDFLAVMSLHAVGIFILMSGFGLTRSMLRRSGGAGPINWKKWYVSRFWRLYPFFWFAHVLFLVAPFVWTAEPIDWRFLVSLTGVRAYPMELMLFYANPAWWFFWLILQLYTVYPPLFWLFRRMNHWWFFVVVAAFSIFTRWLILFVWQDWRGMIIGGLFTSRLAEFALGMAIAGVWFQNPDGFTRRMIGWKPLLIGLVIYPIGLLCYTKGWTYLFVDLLTTAGLFLIGSQVAFALTAVSPIRVAFAFAGGVSLSTFLLHQPWAITLGLHLRGEPAWKFALAAVLFLPAMVGVAYVCEKSLSLLLMRLGKAPQR
jgi:peptidoglycan/LPS O-acetylase OafA/YrhL